jgi:uncharacterized protein (DUF433 family)
MLRFRLVKFERIVTNPKVMGGQPHIRGTNISVATLVDLVTYGHSTERILQAYPMLEPADIKEAMQYMAYRLHREDIPLQATQQNF